jgi:lipoprotein-releasing system permease protein
MPLVWTIGLRYLRARRRSQFVSFISVASMLGIVLGVAALIIVLSVMNGFEHTLRSRLLQLSAHVEVSGPHLDQWARFATEISRHPEVVAVDPYISGRGLLRHGREVSGVAVFGIDPGKSAFAAALTGYQQAGSLAALRPGGFGVVLGKVLAERLQAGVGTRLALVSLRQSSNQTRNTGIVSELHRVDVVGVVDTGMFEFDGSLVVMDRADAARIFRMGEQVSALRVSLEDPIRAPLVTKDLRRSLPRGFRVWDWTWSHANFFRALQGQKTMLFLILALIIAVAAFNIISAMVLVVREKRGETAILRSLGLTPMRVMGVFLVQGGAIGVMGTLVGLGIGLLVSVNVGLLVPALERLVNHRFLPEDVYPISEWSAVVQVPDVLWVCGIGFVLALLATILPAWSASRYPPAEALRYE